MENQPKNIKDLIKNFENLSGNENLSSNENKVSMVKSKSWVLCKRPDGMPKLSDFQLIEKDLPPCKDGDIILEAVSLSVDPYMRYRAREIPLNTPMVGSQVAKVIESKNSKYPVGCHVVSYTGWISHGHLSKEQLDDKTGFGTQIIPDMGAAPKSLALGVLGMPGNTAYFGFLELCVPKEGDTVVVNGAAGAVGSLVVQIAKIKGCKVIAFAGTAQKVAWVKELGADHVFNYKTDNISESLKTAAPNGINCYFDNVGGKFTSEVMPHMAVFGRISVCGGISTYNDESKGKLSSPYSEGLVIMKQLRIEGFMVTRWAARWMEGIGKMQNWVKEGKMKYKETVTKGFENMPSAFIGLFSGDNTGKAIVNV